MTRARRKLLVIAMLILVGGAGIMFAFARLTEEEPNYTLIEKGLYLGGDVPKPPPRTKAVLNLCEKKDPYQCETHVWEPIRDAEPAPDLDWLRKKVELIEARRKAGDTVYVHCRNGVSRSGMVIVAYEMHKNRWTRDEALKFVRSRRPITRPNPAFWDRLREWEFVLLREKKKDR